MYRRRTRSHHGGRRRRMRGRGIMDLVKRGGQFIKANQLVSKGLGALANSGLVPTKYAGYVNTAGQVANSLGYGRRRIHRRHYGGSINLAGMGHRRLY